MKFYAENKCSFKHEIAYCCSLEKHIDPEPVDEEIIRNGDLPDGR